MRARAARKGSTRQVRQGNRTGVVGVVAGRSFNAQQPRRYRPSERARPVNDKAQRGKESGGSMSRPQVSHFPPQNVRKQKCGKVGITRCRTINGNATPVVVSRGGKCSMEEHGIRRVARTRQRKRETRYDARNDDRNQQQIGGRRKGVVRWCARTHHACSRLGAGMRLQEGSQSAAALKRRTGRLEC